VSPVLRDVFHWLTVPQRIQLKTATQTFDCVRCTGPVLFSSIACTDADGLPGLRLSARPSVAICSFQLRSEGESSSSQLQLSGTHCHFTFAPRPSVAAQNSFFQVGLSLTFPPRTTPCLKKSSTSYFAEYFRAGLTDCKNFNGYRVRDNVRSQVCNQCFNF